ncbi:hypothetical protein V9T40_011317 [Parthenolecanium corni]|uniref:TLC domain-containing protein n=1 Tax=Parthenolecanium corni TaxID=536013 RepID=A0AAN9TJT1_9HEMI
MVVKPGRKATKKPPVLSHEFILQNHADIVSCFMVIFVFGMVVPLTSSVCNLFVVLQYASEVSERVIAYGIGLKDICTIFFYSLVCIVLHAVHQEYILSKVGKKLHLSKIKTNMFNESGQLLAFYLLSIVWSGDLIIKEDLLLNIRSLWENYPHLHMPFMLKFFYIVQFGYWVHCFPELYFSKVKREDMPAKIKFAIINLVFVSAAYALNFNRVGVLLLFLHYLSEGFHHFSILFNIFDKEEKNSKITNMVSDIVFALSRVSTIILSLVTFLIGLSKNEKPEAERVEGDFNTLLVRLGSFALVASLQSYLLFFFVKDHTKQLKEMKIPIRSLLQQQPSSQKPLETPKTPKKKTRKSASENELTEADQNLKRTTRAKSVKKIK